MLVPVPQAEEGENRKNEEQKKRMREEEEATDGMDSEVEGSGLSQRVGKGGGTKPGCEKGLENKGGLTKVAKGVVNEIKEKVTHGENISRCVDVSGEGGKLMCDFIVQEEQETQHRQCQFVVTPAVYVLSWHQPLKSTGCLTILTLYAPMICTISECVLRV
jgi:hypothetical protein